MRFSFISTLLLAGSIALSAQSIDSIALATMPISVFVETESGVAIVNSSTSYIGLDPEKGDSIWSIGRGAFAGWGQKASGAANDESSVEDYEDIEGVPFVYIRKQMIDVRNGNMMIGADEDVKNIRRTTLLKERNQILVETSHKGEIKLFSFDAYSGERQFAVKLQDSKALIDASADRDAITPTFDDAGKMLYDNGKSLSLVDTKMGKLIWNLELNAKNVYFQDNMEHFLAAESGGGLLSTTGMGKTVHLINYQTGARLWNGEKGLKLNGQLRMFEPFDGGFILAHTDGMNVYDWGASSEPRWKKDFKEGGIRRFEIKGDVINVTYKGKMMPVDGTSGQAMQKKPEKVGGYFMGVSLDEEKEAKDPIGLGNFNGKALQLISTRKIKLGEDEIYFNRIAMDPVNNRFFTARIIVDKSDPKKNRYTYTLTAHLQDGSTTSQEISVPHGIEHLRANNKGDFFVSNDHLLMHYNIVDGEIALFEDIRFGKFEYGAAKLARRLDKLMGGDEEEGIPGYISIDYDNYQAVKSGRLPVEKMGYANLPYIPIKGMYYPPKVKGEKKKDPVPTFLIYNMETGEAFYRRKTDLNNTNYVADYINKRIFFIHNEQFITFDFN